MKVRAVFVVILGLAMGVAAICTPTMLALADPSGGAESSSGAAADGKRLYCSEHEAYEDECFICHPELREKGRLWCNEHERYEDRCFICHPEIRDETRLYCEKHGLYEDECFLCHPELKQKDAPSDESSGAGGAAGTKGQKAQKEQANRLMCNEHGVFEDECGICHPELAASIPAGRGLKVRFRSAEAAAKAGIETARPEAGVLDATIESYAEIVFNQNQLAHVAIPVSGIIREVSADLGDEVGEGQVLATISSSSIAEAVSKLVLAKQTLDRERRLHAERVSAEREVQEAQAVYQAVYQHLRTLGFAAEQIAGLHDEPADSVALELRAPFAGEIIERNAVQGSLVGEGDSLFVVADRSVMWAMLSIPEAKLPHVRVGQLVELSIEPSAHQTFTGTLTWLAARVDDRTRMAKARVEVPNPEGILRANMFARAVIHTDRSEETAILPSQALQEIDGRTFVFVKLADDLFDARPVRVEAKVDDRVAVVGELAKDSEVVVARSYLVKSQLQISRLGAGCVD